MATGSRRQATAVGSRAGSQLSSIDAAFAREPVGHAGHVRHRGADCLGRAGFDQLERRIGREDRPRGRIGNHVRSIGVVLDEGAQQRDDGVGLVA